MRRYKKSQIYSLKGKSFIQYSQEEKKEATLEVAVGKETMSDILGKTKYPGHHYITGKIILF